MREPSTTIHKLSGDYWESYSAFVDKWGWAMYSLATLWSIPTTLMILTRGTVTDAVPPVAALAVTVIVGVISGGFGVKRVRERFFEVNEE